MASLLGRSLRVELRSGRRLLDGVDVRVDAHETVAVVGPSGAGKSTLLAALAGLLSNTRSLRCQGDVWLEDCGTRFEARPPQVAVVPQAANVLGSRSATQNVVLGSLASGVSRKESAFRSDSALSIVGMASFGNVRANRLSGGERQRVAIARALAMGARFVLADEPTGNLDSESSRTVWNALAALPAHGTGLLVVTHDLDLASECDRQLALTDGLLESAPTS